MKKTFQEPIVEILLLHDCDVVSTSDVVQEERKAMMQYGTRTSSPWNDGKSMEDDTDTWFD